MAGGELYGVWVQTITNDTTPANVEKYGEVEDMAEAYRDGFAKDFCDGQTSPTPPRWPDDGMQLIYTYDAESARLISEFLREEIGERAVGGELNLPLIPSWGGDYGIVAQIAEAATDLRNAAQASADVAASPAASAEALEEWGRNIYENAVAPDDIPEGWYVHGREGRTDINTGRVIQFSRSWDTADFYAGVNDRGDGSVWMARPSDSARVLDFTDTSGADMNDLVTRIVDDIGTYLENPDDVDMDYGGMLSEIINDIESNTGETLADLDKEARSEIIDTIIRESFAPPSIVDHAGAYDNETWYAALFEIYGYDTPLFIITPDGAAALTSEAILGIRVH